MANYEQDVVSVSDGALVTLKEGDIIVGAKSDLTTFLILRIQRASVR